MIKGLTSGRRQELNRRTQAALPSDPQMNRPPAPLPQEKATPMNTFSRRGFLGLAGVAGTTIGLSACAGTGRRQLHRARRAPRPRRSALKRTPAPPPARSSSGPTTPAPPRTPSSRSSPSSRRPTPGVKVNLVDAGKNYEEVAQKFNAALAGGQLPDVVVVSDVTWFNFALNKQLAPIDDLAKTIDARHQRLRRRAPTTTTSSRTVTTRVPYARSTPLFYYNKDLWAKAGLEDRGPKDWTEMKDWMVKLKPHSTGRRRRHGPRPTAPTTSPGSSRTCCGSSVAATPTTGKPTFTDAKTLEALTFFQDLVKQGYVQVRQGPRLPTSAPALTACANHVDRVARWRDEEREVPVHHAFLPGKDNCPTGGAGVGIPAGLDDARKVNAMKFAAFLTNASRR
jgi:sn-glycerol 3-phosphate transport system substrate-binding protein